MSGHVDTVSCPDLSHSVGGEDGGCVLHGEDGLAVSLQSGDEDLSITVEGEEWFRNTDVMFHQNGEEISLSRGNLRLNSTHCCSLGQDKVGTFVRVDQSWSHKDLTFLTSVQTYPDTIIFTQGRFQKYLLCKLVDFSIRL